MLVEIPLNSLKSRELGTTVSTAVSGEIDPERLLSSLPKVFFFSPLTSASPPAGGEA